MADELIDIFDDHDNPTHTTAMKSLAHQEGLWHRSAHIWIYTGDGELLLQKRQDTKDFFPSVWDCAAAGHVGACEDPQTSAVRELEEELGITIAQKDLDFFRIEKESFHYNTIFSQEHCYEYLLRYTRSENLITLQEEEVAEARFLPIQTLRQELKEHPERFIPHAHWLDIIAEIEKRLSKR